eukprot:5303442-Prymnesium_polylepis.2
MARWTGAGCTIVSAWCLDGENFDDMRELRLHLEASGRSWRRLALTRVFIVVLRVIGVLPLERYSELTFVERHAKLTLVSRHSVLSAARHSAFRGGIGGRPAQRDVA